MKCIDAIEGTVKKCIRAIYELNRGSLMDDSEYIRQIRGLIEATDSFVCENPEVSDDPKILKTILYQYAKDLWLDDLLQRRRMELEAASASVDADESSYLSYYYDYIFNKGVYPQ